jgi:hypothetical protein
VRRWNGSAWEEVGAGSASGGGISNNSGDSKYPALAVAPDGTPYIAWDDTSDGDAEIYVRRWNGSAWEEVGTGSSSDGGISDNSGDSRRASVAITPGGTPYVTWDDTTGGDVEIYVRRWRQPYVYLPIVLRPSLTHLYVKSTNTGGINPVEIRDPNNGNTLLLTCVIGNNVTEYCGSFAAIGTYKFIAFPRKCPRAERTFSDAVAGATVTREVECH